MRQRKMHFIGIGGAGMSGLAQILLAQGVAVSGSDLSASAATRRLRALGARVYIGHRASHVHQEAPDTVVISSAVPPGNPELVAARERRIPVVTRGELLARLMEERVGIAVAGTHGKTTTTSMIALSLERAGLDPTIAIGGELHDIGSNAKLGHGPYFVAEADESDRSFLHLRPRIAVVTNIEADHLENYGSTADIVQAFRQFVGQVPADGLVVLGIDNAHAAGLAPLPCRHVTYALERPADYTVRDVRLAGMGSRSVVLERGTPLGELELRVPGLHNIANALAAVAVGRHLGIEFPALARALAGFRGAKRRFEILGEERGILVIDDYAHHPTEIRATLAAARPLYRRVVAVFQPHRYTRTQYFWRELAESFGDADCLVLTDIYAALEQPIPGVTIERMYAAARAAGGDKVHLVRDKEAIPGYLLALTRPGDVVITLGAGDVRRVGEQFLALLRAGEAMVAHLTGPGGPRAQQPANRRPGGGPAG
ncbi:MAG TPA: UDP-N-acetylmuramate--L-alanine ligase [Limnochordales bacterium]|nr:UDP-N-acetylmuramate--L-alanine ligase [Limnochordales bacterium]